jgi:hypothetical protein
MRRQHWMAVGCMSLSLVLIPALVPATAMAQEEVSCVEACDEVEEECIDACGPEDEACQTECVEEGEKCREECPEE